ncbi:TRAP transporter small permease subunit [Acuticoccus sediminis]|nr:TRAP transporter small permease [Acuticoccus sediminis]
MKAVVDVLDRIAGALALVAAWCAAAIMVFITGHILTEIVLRSFFGTSTQVLEEFVGYGLGAMVFLALGHALRQGKLVRVDIVLGKLPSRARRALEVVLCLVTLAVMAFVMKYFWISVSRNYQRGTISMTTAATPMWIPEAVIFAGMGIFWLTLAVYALRLLVGGALIEESGINE